jgi:hypothetical protein
MTQLQKYLKKFRLTMGTREGRPQLRQRCAQTLGS